MNTKRNHLTSSVEISTEARAERIFETFVAEHVVPKWLYDDLKEEIIMAIECYCGTEDSGGNTSLRQSELYQYMESYLYGWVRDNIEYRSMGLEDLVEWGLLDDESIVEYLSARGALVTPLAIIVHT